MTDKTNPKVDPEVQIEEALSKSEQFLRKNGRKIIGSIIVAVVLAGAIFGYLHLIKMPAEQKALNNSFAAQQLFALEQYETALNGDGTNMGFLEIADKYSSTPTGNTANHYAGICYMYLGDYQKAIASFEKYSPAKGTPSDVINAQNAGLIADAYSQLNDYAKAAEYYEKAAKIENEFSTPYYLKKAGVVYLALGDTKKAQQCFETIKNTYFESMEARDIDKYIGKCAE